MNLFNYAYPLILIICLCSLILVICFLQREINRRRQIDFILIRQAEREKLIYQITQQIRQSLDLEEILKTTVTEVRNFLQADRVLIYRIWNNGTGSAMTENVLPPYPEILGETFPEEVFPQEYHRAYIEGKIRTINDVEKAEIEDCLAEFVKQFGVKAKLVVPIIQQIRNHQSDCNHRVETTSMRETDTFPTPYLWGLLIVHQCKQPRIWEEEEIELMKQLANQVAIAIQQSELYNQLQKFNTKLEDRVEQRTQQLALTNESLKAEIIEHQRTEKALRLSEQRFRQIVENTLDMITILEPNGIIYYQNPSVEKVLGYTPEQFKSTNFFSYINPDDLNNIRSGILDVIEEQKIVRPIEFLAQNKQGEWCYLEAIAQKFINNVPQTRIIVTSRDISERKRLEEIRRALEQEKELNQVKTRFFSMVSHEFRTPLSTVLAAAQVLENASYFPDNQEKQLRNLHRIQSSVKNMVQLLDDILTINRAETGNLEFNPQPIALEKFCQQLIEEIKLSTGAKHKLKFNLYREEGINPNPTLDEKLLRSILTNLLSNAIKYSPQGSLIDLYLIFSLDQLEFQIKDRGIGISQEDQEEIFEPFYRSLNVKHLTGTGLGLAVVKKCVDLHGGNISITSEVNKATMVTVIFPVN